MLGLIITVGRGILRQKGGRVLGGIALLGAEVHGTDALLEPVGIETKLLEKLHVPVAWHGIPAFCVGNA